MKICTSCKIVKEFIYFYKNKSQSDGYRSKCKSCEKQEFLNYPTIIVDNIQCHQCNLIKSTDQFSKRSSSKTGLNTICRNCMANNYAEDLSAQVKIKQRVRERADINRTIAKSFIKEVKNTPCVDCGNIYESYCMEFDHIYGNKVNKISSMVAGGATLKKIKEEINKCEIVCVMCHRDRTFKRLEGNKINGSTLQLKPNKKRNNSLYEYIILLKNNPCNMCGIKYNHWQMDFDHLKPFIKISSISAMIHDHKPKIEILNEINKCQLLCALCHRRKTFSDFNYLTGSQKSEQ